MLCVNYRRVIRDDTVTNASVSSYSRRYDCCVLLNDLGVTFTAMLRPDPPSISMTKSDWLDKKVIHTRQY